MFLLQNQLFILSFIDLEAFKLSSLQIKMTMISFAWFYVFARLGLSFEGLLFVMAGQYLFYMQTTWTDSVKSEASERDFEAKNTEDIYQ